MAAPLLVIDRQSGAWRAVVQYAQERMALLIETCTSLTVTDAERRDAAARIAELRELVEAPAEAVKVGANRAEHPRETY